jgi:hypothetical protein
MCMCEKPTINGQPGYRWNTKDESVYPVNPPKLIEGDVLLFDEPGRCGGCDSHSHHFRLVNRRADYWVLVRHGGGEEAFRLASHRVGTVPMIEAMSRMDTHQRYWTLHLLYYIHHESSQKARDEEGGRWMLAAMEKRIKVRKSRRPGVAPQVKIIPKIVVVA